ncbi:MAG: hypothetical protein ACE5LU_29595 [Anaerolineae bacterium]
MARQLVGEQHVGELGLPVRAPATVRVLHLQVCKVDLLARHEDGASVVHQYIRAWVAAWVCVSLA